jgi:hypothetical protein
MKIAASAFCVCVSCFPLLAACNTSDPTSALLLNEYPPNATSSTASTTVYKGWWSVALFPDPVLAGQTSDPERAVPGTDYGYALLAPGWDPSSGTPPTGLIPVRSTEKLSVVRGNTLNFLVSDSRTLGNCAGGQALSQEEADFITQRIFPGEFANLNYDATTCTAVTADLGGAGGEGGGEQADSTAGQIGTSGEAGSQ